MKIVMLSLDAHVFDQGSRTQERMKLYGSKVRELIFCLPYKEKKEDSIASNVRILGSGGSNKVTQFFALWGLARREVARGGVDCITVQDPFFLGLIGCVLAWWYKVAFNVQIHGVFFGNELWRRESFFNRVREVIARCIVRRADSVRVVSNELVRGVVETGVAQDEIIVAPPFVDIQAFREKKTVMDVRAQYADFDFIFLIAGRLEAVKNIPLVLRAFAQVRTVRPKALLLIVGGGSERASLEALALALGIEQNVRFEEWSHAIHDYYDAADVLLFPSLHESFGMTPLEALVRGCPVIAARVGWINEDACEREPGIVCVPDYAEQSWVRAMTEATKKLYTPGDALFLCFAKESTLGEQCRAWELAVSNSKKYRLLFITQKIHQHDDDLAFVIQWVDEWKRQGARVRVVCLERGVFDNHFPVHSLGKECGVGLLGRLVRFYGFVFTLPYNRVFVHMNPEYMTLAGWYWWISRRASYLWYTHYTMHIHLKLSHLFCKRLFAATPQSMPMYTTDPKRIITGHGVQVDFWGTASVWAGGASERLLTELVSVHRLCRSKRLDIGIRALALLPAKYRLTVYGRDVEKDYVAELYELVTTLGLQDRVIFKGPVPMADLRAVYPQYAIMVNMAYETIDKTMLEGMLCGVYPVTTLANAQAIGLPSAPVNDTPEAVADFVAHISNHLVPLAQLRGIVEERHSLKALVEKMNFYVKQGI